MPTIRPDRLDDLILARLTASKPPSDLARDLAALAPSDLAPARWADEVAAALARLEAAGLVEKRRTTAEAAQALGRRLGVAGAVAWKSIRERTLPGRALAPDDPRAVARLSGRDAWAAAVAARALGLWTAGPPPSASAVAGAVVWRALGLPGKPRPTPPEIRAYFLRQLLGTGSGPPERLLALLAAREAGAPRADLRALREALVRRWLCATPWSQPGAAAGRAPAPSTPPAPGVGAFATAVRDAAERASDGVFGGRKVFISSLWRSMRGGPALGDMTLDEFKQQLVAAHKAGLVALARADLTAAMDPGAVRESETAHLEARYHFVERRGTP